MGRVNEKGEIKPCIHKNDFDELKKHLLDSDIIAFVTPMYYFGMSSTLKK